MFNHLQYACSLIGILSMAIAPAVRAEAISSDHNSEGRASHTELAIADDLSQSLVNDVEGAAIAQQSETVIQVTGLQVTETETGLTISLETTNDRTPQTFTSRHSETVVIDLVNTQLNLATGEPFGQDNPAAGIASIRVEPLDTNSVRITVIGAEQAPTAALVQANGELVVSVATADALANQPSADPTDEVMLNLELPADEDAIRIVVTGEPTASPYLTPDAPGVNRTDTSIFEIPQTIQVLPQQLLEDQQVIRLQDALLNVPNAVRGNNSGAGSENIVIRGFNNTQVLRDGFRDTGAAGAGNAPEQFANVERVEVLSGPASILYGNLEPGGVVNLVTKRPLSEFFLETGVQVGSFGLVRPTLDISGPLTGNGSLLYRLNAAYEFSEGFRDFNTDIEQFFVAPVLEWRISDRTTLTFDLEYTDDRRPFDRGILFVGGEPLDFPRDTIIGEPDDFAEVETLRVAYRLDHEFSDTWQLRNRFRYGATDYLTSRAELFADLGGGNLGRVFVSNDSQLKTFEGQTELVGEFITGSIEHTLLLGFDVFFSDVEQTTSFQPALPINVLDLPVVGIGDRPNPPFANITSDVNNELYQVGLILQDQIQISPELTLLLGGRLDFAGLQVQDPVREIDNEQDFTNFSPRVGLVYQPVEPLFFYASYSQSFLPSNGVSTTVEGELLDPEEAEQFEVGVKAELLEGRLAATLALFDITQENVAAPDLGNVGFFIPIGEQTSSGLELVLQGEILPGWNVAASYGFLDSEITESGGQFPEGAIPRNTPQNTASLFTSYEIQSGALEGLGFGVGVFFVDDRFGDFDNTLELDSYWRTDVSVFYQLDRWRAGLNFRNLFDVDYFESGSFPLTGIPGEPFTVLGSLSVTF